jgi:2-polyprenyl-6-hydroxyphenyl methylase/3-demethylubiquinone-9 3-methyltransferase
MPRHETKTTDAMSQHSDAVAHFSSYVTQFDAYYHQRPEFEERLALWRGLLDKYATPGGLSVDMGCGTGVFSLYLASKGGQVIGVDGAAEMVAFCDERSREQGLENIRFMHGRLPNIDESVLTPADLLISSSVVEYVPDLDATLALFARLVKPHGTMILSFPNVFSLSRAYERAKYRLTGQPAIYQHILHFTSPARLHARVRHYGFRLAEAHHYTHYTRLAKLTRAAGLPPPLTEDLFVAVFRRD